MGILFNCTALGIHLCKTSQLYVLKTRLGGEIYSSDVNMHKGYYYKPIQNNMAIRFKLECDFSVQVHRIAAGDDLTKLMKATSILITNGPRQKFIC